MKICNEDQNGLYSLAKVWSFCGKWFLDFCQFFDVNGKVYKIGAFLSQT